jgi:phosphoglycolate phosphatase-like HAD superfamily hydrolase
MLERALGKYNIKKENALFIGDSERDKIAGENGGIRSIQVKANTSILELSKMLVHE